MSAFVVRRTRKLVTGSDRLQRRPRHRRTRSARTRTADHCGPAFDGKRHLERASALPPVADSGDRPLSSPPIVNVLHALAIQADLELVVRPCRARGLAVDGPSAADRMRTTYSPSTGK